MVQEMEATKGRIEGLGGGEEGGKSEMEVLELKIWNVRYMGELMGALSK